MQLELFTGPCGPYDCEPSDRGFCLWCNFPCRSREDLRRAKRLAEAANATVVRLWRQDIRLLGLLCDASGLSVPRVWGVLRGLGVTLEDLPRWSEDEAWALPQEAA